MIVAALAALVAVMMEEVHERAGKDEEIRQSAEEVCAMLGDQEEPGDDQKANQD